MSFRTCLPLIFDCQRILIWTKDGIYLPVLIIYWILNLLSYWRDNKARFSIYFFQLVTKVVSFQLNWKKQSKNTLHAHIIHNIVKISLKRVEMNFCPGIKNSINGKTARYDRFINELCHFYKVSLIKTGLMFHKYHLLNQLQVFMRYKKLPKWVLISL